MTIKFNRQLILGAALLCTAPAFGAPIAIVNGDFELDAADNVAPPTGWIDESPDGFWTGVADEVGNPTAAQAAAAPGSGLGDYFLTTARQSAGVGSQSENDLLTQTVDLSAFGGLIDAGDQVLEVDFVWSSNDGRDTGAFDLSFYSSTDGTGAPIGAGYSVALDDDNGFAFTGWFEETVGGVVPVSARSVTLSISTARSGGSETNIWIDNISGSIGQPVPEPGSALLLVLGLTAVGFCKSSRS
ncbi:hypothetical protein Pla108_42090 [Botrimarina colliarenosi]|uniref:PEP-CTERM protein-sorting domain-containing protein n=1 Tax=Botrimarina colliarenosi TaxID=2528001 RepID=A0A5C5ZX72_9BACT|nr:PEP-CTERM sorting domain-containing protein [Botrimarina colliarenosi]TWT91726.1 hypothetical protein Pla108_42090 [Botrimarina colliarenosi]